MRTPPWALPALLLALAVGGTAAGAPTFRWRDRDTREWLVCSQCPPGTFVQRPCGRDSPTACGACPQRHYTQFWNYLERCRYCNVICGEREEEAQPCTATHNRACRCRAGHFAHAGFCLEHAPCPPGTGVVAPGGCRSPGGRHWAGIPAAPGDTRLPLTPSSPSTPGTASQNTQCQPCPPGTFSASSSISERCRPHRNCTALGLAVNVPASSSHDALCTSCRGFPPSRREPGDPGEGEPGAGRSSRAQALAVVRVGPPEVLWGQGDPEPHQWPRERGGAHGALCRELATYPDTRVLGN